MSISYTKKIWQNGDLLDAASLNNLESGAGANADAISEIQAALPSYVGSSIARKQAAAYTPGTADQIIGANQYLAGPQTIKGDPDLKAENIKSGVNIFGVDGSYEGSGSGGLDTSDATATEADIVSPATAYVDGEKVTGSLVPASIDLNVGTFYVDADSNKNLRFKTVVYGRKVVDDGQSITLKYPISNLGDATAADVAAGKTFTSAAGLKVTGTHQCASGLDTSDATAAAADIVSGKTAYVNGVTLTGTHTCPSGGAELQSKVVTPGKIAQIIKPDSGYDGLSQVTVNGDADLVPGNIKSGVNIFGVDGNYEGSGGGGLTVATGTTTSGTIETGLSSLAYLVLYKDSISATGLVQAVYVASEGTSHMTTCDSYSSYFKSFSASTSTADTTNGGTFNWGGTGTKALNGTYNWIAFGAA